MIRYVILVLVLLFSVELDAQYGFSHQLRGNPGEVSYYWSLRPTWGFYSPDIHLVNISVLHQDPFNDGPSYSATSIGSSLITGTGTIWLLWHSLVTHAGQEDKSLTATEFFIGLFIVPFALTNTEHHLRFLDTKASTTRPQFCMDVLIGNRTDYYFGQADAFWRFAPSAGIEISLSGKLAYDPDNFDAPGVAWPERHGLGLSFGVDKFIDINEGESHYRPLEPYVSLRYIHHMN